MEVLEAEDAHGVDFVFEEEVAEIAFTVALDFGFVVFELFVFDVETAFVGEKSAVAGEASGVDAVEHVDAAIDGFEEVFGGADAHEVARFFV